MRSTAVAVLLAAALTAAAAPAATAPRLRVLRDAPLVVGGSGFRAYEPLRISVTIGERHLLRRATASAVGGFTARFADVRLDRCATPLVIAVRGARSGLVTVALPPRECAVP